jgi:hypothetical protein
MSEEHRCAGFPGENDWQYYGPAIGVIEFQERSGNWLAQNGDGEYGTYIRFCPFCGVELAQNVGKTST